jgi:predicted lipoprotein with Yx(FWY)xxD motif
MTRTKILSLLSAAAAVVLVAVVVAGCGAGDDQATASSGASMPGGGSAAIGLSDVSGLGKVLVDSKGRTVYLFEKDTGPKSTCFGACAGAWPPVTVTGMPSAGPGVMQSMLGTTKRPEGTMQVTYNGHPLYRYQGDRKPGDAAGQNVDGFGAEWYVISPAGSKVESMAVSSGGGYGY